MLCTVCLNYLNGLLFAPALLLLCAAVSVAVVLLRGYTFNSMRGVPFKQQQQTRRRRYR